LPALNIPQWGDFEVRKPQTWNSDLLLMTSVDEFLKLPYFVYLIYKMGWK
jgi:hypothetical protein